MSLKKIYFSLFLIGCFFLPFNDFEGFPVLGEFKNETGAFFFFAGFIVLIIECLMTGKLPIPYRSPLFKVLCLFLIWCFVTTLLNVDSVSQNFFKHTTGFSRFFRQYFSLTLSTVFFFIFYWNIVSKMSSSQILFTIRKILLLGLVFTFVYGFLETLIVIFHIGPLRPMLALFDYFPFLDVNYPSVDRISSVAYESPALGNYLITVSGWMFSYILTEKNKYRFLPTVMVLFLTFFSGSRTALINVGLQLFILIYVMYSMKEYKAILLNTLTYTVIIAFIALILNGQSIIKEIDKKADSLNFSKNLKDDVSNQSRFGMQYASLQVFKENPIIGVGFGQETYHKRKHYPGWAKNNNYEFKLLYENQNVKSFPTAYNLYTRLLAETGLVGISLWLFLIYLTISKSKLIWKEGKNEEKTLGLILLISFSGLSLNWMQTDFFRQYGFWLCFAILIKITNSLNHTSIYPKNNNSSKI